MATKTIDWESAEAVAERLGIQTRRLVAEQQVETARDWCLRMARENNDATDPRRSMSYFELAVLLGHSEPEIADLVRREWRELMPEVQKLAAAVRLKVNEEEAAARARAEADARAAEQSAGDSSDDVAA